MHETSVHTSIVIVRSISKTQCQSKVVIVSTIESSVVSVAIIIVRILTITITALMIWGPFLESPEKPFVKLRPAYSLKLVFLYVVKRIKIKITATFVASRRLRLEDTKRIMSPEMRPKSLGTFEKRAPGMNCLDVIVSGAAGMGKREKEPTSHKTLVSSLLHEVESNKNCHFWREKSHMMAWV